MDRVVITGSSGAGKSTLGHRLGAVLQAPHVELDALYHGPGWQPRASFEADVDAFVATARWVVDSGGYPLVRERIWARADTVVWLDYRKALVMSRVIRRSAARALTRRPLWNGNRETVWMWRRPDHPIRWTWTNYAEKRELARRLVSEPRFAHLDVIRLTEPHATDRWLERLDS